MSIEFVPAVCPKCGGELRVPSNLNVVKCLYCGNDVILQNSNQVDVKVELISDVTKLQKLARIAEESRNYAASYDYYTKILEANPDNRSSWLGKARAAAKLCNATSTALDESISYFNIALQYGKSIDTEAVRTIYTIAGCTRDYFQKIAEYYYNEFQRREPPPVYDPLLEFGRGDVLQRLYKDIERRFEIAAQQGIRSFQFCLDTAPSKVIGQYIFDSYHIIANAPNPIFSYQKYLKSITEYVQQQYPELGKPQGADRNCFIATATVGCENHPYVCTLRNYRDLVLTKSMVGKHLIRGYYFISPPFARLISKYQTLRKISLQIIVLPAYKIALKGLNKNKNNHL